MKAPLIGGWGVDRSKPEKGGSLGGWGGIRCTEAARPAPGAGRATSVQRIPPQPPKLPPFSGLERSTLHSPPIKGAYTSSLPAGRGGTC